MHIRLTHKLYIQKAPVKASLHWDKMVKVASAAGKAAHKKGTAHKWTPEAASQAGKISAKKRWGWPDYE